jgi:hypothetical protein
MKEYIDDLSNKNYEYFHLFIYLIFLPSKNLPQSSFQSFRPVQTEINRKVSSISLRP